MAPLLERWTSTWRALGVAMSPGLGRLHQRLIAAYSEPHRHYHTLQHLQECFERLDEIGALAQRLPEVELALWFHDAIYQARRSDNEEKSAGWARQAARDAGVDRASAQRVHELVLVTRHGVAPGSPDEQVLVDVDLSILGAGEARFAEYEEQVRREYGWVPGFLYRRKRAQILAGFLERPRIFSTQPFFERFEAAARANLQRSLRGRAD